MAKVTQLVNAGMRLISALNYYTTQPKETLEGSGRISKVNMTKGRDGRKKQIWQAIRKLHCKKNLRTL